MSIAEAKPNCPAAAVRRIGLVAGWGRYPIVVADALNAAGFEIHCLGIRDHADRPILAGKCAVYEEVGFAQVGRAIRMLRRRDVRLATMAGKIHKTLLYQPWFWWRHLPDLRTLRMFFDSFVLAKRDRRDDTLLGTIVAEFAKDGVMFAPATDFAPDLLVEAGTLTRREPTVLERADIEFGWHLAKEMGRLDVGQSVAVKGRAALAVEAIEGTDECIARAGRLCPAGRFTIVKTAKPQQDMRYDVPTIGRRTIEQMARAGASCLAVEARRTIVIDPDEVIETADRHGISIVACGDEDLSVGSTAPTSRRA